MIVKAAVATRRLVKNGSDESTLKKVNFKLIVDPSDCDKVYDTTM